VAAAFNGAVGWPEIDAFHEEFDRCAQHLCTASDDALAAALAELQAHLKRHFGGEERMMVASGFPIAACHMREHDSVTAVVTEVQRRLAAGDVAIARTLAAELPHWFEVHVGAHDAALAAFLRNKEDAPATACADGARGACA